jgi:hypothetical protein
VTSADGLAARIFAGECGQCLDGVDQAREASGGGERGCGNGLLADGDEAGRDLVAVFAGLQARR